MGDNKIINMAELHAKIDELITLDNQRQSEQAKKYPDGILINYGSSDSDAVQKDVLQREKSPVISALEQLSTDELAYVMALMWFGRGDGIAEEGATFDSVLDYAKKEIDKQSVFYVAEKPLGTYLPQGLKRLENLAL